MHCDRTVEQDVKEDGVAVEESLVDGNRGGIMRTI
jgi:hypothetical protein